MTEFNFKELNDEYLYIIEDLRVISIFDSVFYESHDHDGLGPSQKKYLIERLLKRGFHQTSGKTLRHPNGDKVIFPGSKIFDHSFSQFANEHQNSGSWLVLTPTQTAYMLFKAEPFSFLEITQLISQQPFNIEKLARVCFHEPFLPLINQHYTELVRLHERAKILLKSKSHLGRLL